MNILIFTLEFPPMLGGAGTYSYELANGLFSIGNSITLLTSDRGIDVKIKSNESGVKEKFKVIRKKWHGKIWFLEWPFILKKHLSENRYDLIIFANQGAVVIGTKVYKNLKTPYLCTLHGSERYTFLADKPPLKTRIMVSPKSLKFFLEKANKVICVSKDLYQDIRKIVSTDVCLKMIPLGISDMFKHKKKLQHLHLENINIVCTARFVKGKGQERIIKAFKEVLNHRKLANLYFIGDGVELANMQKLCDRLGINKNVHFKGLMDRASIAQFYREEADIFIMLSSFKETFGLVYLEAMYSSLPVIGSDYGAVPDIIQDGVNGYLIKIENQTTENIKNIILKTLDNRLELGEASFALASNYSNIEMAKKHTFS